MRRVVPANRTLIWPRMWLCCGLCCAVLQWVFLVWEFVQTVFMLNIVRL